MAHKMKSPALRVRDLKDDGARAIGTALNAYLDSTTASSLLTVLAGLDDALDNAQGALARTADLIESTQVQKMRDRRLAALAKTRALNIRLLTDAHPVDTARMRRELDGLCDVLDRIAPVPRE